MFRNPCFWFLFATHLSALSAFSPPQRTKPAGRHSLESVRRMGLLDAWKDFNQAVDDFVDDAMDRKLGNGASFYGKRKSGFYGEADSMKKEDPRIARADEDYQGPTGSGYFTWGRNEDGRLQPQSRMKKKAVERLINNEFPKDGMRED